MADKTSLEKTIDKINGCKFDTDVEENLNKNRILNDIQVLIRTKKFQLEADFQKTKNELLISDEIQKGGGTKDVKEARLELELAGDPSHERIREYNLMLNIIHVVEAHNERVLSMYFNFKSKEKN